MTLIEVLVAFIVLMVALLPLSYLFTTSIIQAGQSKNQVQALSIAEQWVEIASNVTPPVNCNGEVVVDQSVPPTAPGSPSTTVNIGAPANLATQTTIPVASTTGFAAAPAVALVSTTTGLQSVTYSAKSATAFTIPAGSGTGTISTGCPVTQPTVSEVKGTITYSLKAEYEWTTAQNSGVGATTVTAGSNNLDLSTCTVGSPCTVNVVGTGTFAAASPASPQTAVIATAAGAQTVTYTGETATTFTGVYGGTGKMSTGGAVSQDVQPDLCTSGTPQLLKLRMNVSWGPNADVNNMQDSVILNYPPSGIQTLGFIALQMSGDTTALDSQGDPWNERVQAPQVQITGPQNLTIYPDNYGCAFAQVLPSSVGNTYTVTVVNATSGIPQGTTYGTPSFVANGTGTVTANVLQQPTSETQAGIAVSIGTVTKLASTYPLSYPGYDQGSMVNLAYPSTSAVEDGVACPGAGQITCISSGENGSGAVLTWSNQSTWSKVTLPTPATRIASLACAGSGECEGVGYNLTGGVSTGVILDANPSTPSVAAYAGPALTGVTSLSQIQCPSPTTCVAIGTTASGAVVLVDTIVGGVDSWTAATLPANITGLTSLVCPPSGSGCVALGTSSTPAAGTPIAISGGFGSLGVAAVWTNDTFTGFTLSSLSSLACPSNTNCMAIGIGKVGAGATGPIAISGVDAAGIGSGAVAFTADTFPALTTVQTLNGLTCPSGSVCLATGTGTKGAGTVPLVMYAAPTASSAFGNDTLPTVSGAAVTSLTQMSCPTGGACVLIGATATGPAILSGAITAPTTADTWTNAPVPTVSAPATLTQLTLVQCWSATSCAIAGFGTNSQSQPAGYLLATTGPLTSWSQVGIPSSVLYLSDIDCTISGSPTYCSAVGATATGAVELTSATGPAGTWSDQTPSGLSGNVTQGVPIEINNTGLLPNPYANVVTAGAAANITQLPDLFPFNGGYALFAGDCSTELGAGGFNVSQTSTIPGGSTNSTVPMGLLTVQALHASGPSVGLPYAGATFKLTATSCSADQYTLQKAGPDGLSRTEVPFGSYTLSVTGASAVTEPVTVGGSAVVANGVTVPFPGPATVSVP